ncbi:MAG: DUF2807 domain-containing protein [Bacteroidota bacterium]
MSELRNTESFSTIIINNKIDVTIFNGPAYKVEVLAGAHIIKNISTSVKGGALNIENNNTCNFVRGYKKNVRVNITAPFVKLVFNDGVGTVRFSDNFTQDTLVVKAGNSGDIHINGHFKEIRTSSHGNGDIYINGVTNTLFVYTKGTNFLNAQNLAVYDYAFIETLSIGDCYLNAENLQKFEYNIWKSGNIYYTGTPAEINDFSDHKGKGQAIKK